MKIENFKKISVKSPQSSNRKKSIKLENKIKISLKKAIDGFKEDSEIQNFGSFRRKKNLNLPINPKDLTKIPSKRLKSLTFKTLFLAKKFIGNLMKTSI